ncbi:hypothetical protein HanIR_Chr09g0390391 [Helianthus annuus]|nr:hypothetical protein HanIR_Chr09g0390391 [Helianthus annuus]
MVEKRRLVVALRFLRSCSAAPGRKNIEEENRVLLIGREEDRVLLIYLNKGYMGFL